MAALSDNTIPSLPPPPSTLCYYATSRPLAFKQLLQPYHDMIWEMVQQSDFTKLAAEWQFSFVQASMATVVKNKNGAIALHDGFNPCGISTANPHTRPCRRHRCLITCWPPCTPLSLSSSSLLNLHVLRLAVSTIMYPPFIIHGLNSWREHERGIPPWSNKTERACFVVQVKIIMLHI